MSLLLVDMDGTLREPLSGHQYFQHTKDQRIITGAQTAISAYKDNWIIVGISNQGGVAAGHKSMQECIKQQQYTLELLPQLKEIYFCPDFEGRKCFRVTPHNVHNHSKTKWSGQYRKPRPGMLQLAMVRYKYTPNNSLYVGDRPEDEEAAQRAGISFLSARDWIEQHRDVAERVMI